MDILIFYVFFNQNRFFCLAMSFSYITYVVHPHGQFQLGNPKLIRISSIKYFQKPKMRRSRKKAT